MKLNMKLPNLTRTSRAIIIIALLLFTASIVLIVYLNRSHQKEYRETITIREHSFSTQIASTPEQKEKGLMGVESLSDEEGMLFVYEEKGYRTFWMKDTLIPLDMIFVDDNHRIVDIFHNVSPCTTELCSAYRSAKKAMYVLEVNGGLSKNYGFEIGDLVEFSGLE